MGITKQYLRYVPSGTCNIVGSVNGVVAAVNHNVCAVTACETVNFYNTRTCEKIKQFVDSDNAVTTLKFSNDKRFLAIGYSDGVIKLFDRYSEDESPKVSFAGHKTGVNCLCFNGDGLLLASGGKDSVIIVWDIVNESGLYRLNGHKSSVTQLQFTDNDNFLISSSKDSFVKFWNLSSQSCFYTLTESRSEVYTFALIKNDTLLLLGTAALEILVFRLRWSDQENFVSEEITGDDKKLIRLLPGTNDVEDQANKFVRCEKLGELLRHSKGRALQFAVSPDEKFVTCVGSSDLVDIYRLYSHEESQKRITKKLRKVLKRKEENDEVATVSKADIEKDVTVVVSHVGVYHSEAKVKWIDFIPLTKNIETNVTAYQFYALLMSNTVHTVSLSVNLKSNSVECSTICTLDQLGHRSDVRCLANAESDFGFASGSSEAVLVWSKHSLKVIHVCKDEEMKNVTAVLFVPDDRHIIAATKEGSMFMFELASNELIQTRKKAHGAAIWKLISTPDKKGCISCGSDKVVRYWAYTLGTTRKGFGLQEKRLLELPEEVLCVAASKDSRFIVVGLLDNTARIYFVDTFKFSFSLYGHTLPVTCVDFASDSRLIITGSADKCVRIWGADYGDCHKHLLAHDDVVNCVQFVPKESLFWSAGKDGLLKQWDAEKFERIQVLNLHFAEIRSIVQTSNGKFLISASHDKSIRLWELTEQIIVLQEEEELEREKEQEKRMMDFEDVVPGEETDMESGLAAKKSILSIKSAEDVIEAVEIVRRERVDKLDDPKSESHPLIVYLQSKSLDHFVLDIIDRVPSSCLEKSLLMVPFSFVPDILRALSACVSKHYKVELASRTLLFFIKVHFYHIINCPEMVSILDTLRSSVRQGIMEIRDVCGFNFAGLRLMQKEMEEALESKFFSDVSELGKRSKKKKVVKA